MIVLKLHLDGDGAFADLADRRDQIIELDEGSVMHIAGLAGGMASGRPSVMFRFDLPDGRVVIAQTSLALFQVAAAGLTGRYGDVT